MRQVFWFESVKTQILKAFNIFKTRLLGGFFWGLSSSLAYQGSILISTILVSRMLGLRDFGIYALLVSMVMMVSSLAQSGSGLLATKYVSEFLKNQPKRVEGILNLCRFVTLVTGGVSSLGIFIFSEQVANNIFNRPELNVFIEIASIAIFFQISIGYQLGAIIGFKAFRKLGHAGVISGIGYIGLTIFGAWIYGLQGALWGFNLASLLRLLVVSIILKEICRDSGIDVSQGVVRGEVGLIWKIALPTSLAGFITITCLWATTVLISKTTNGLEWVAIFTVINQIRLTIIQFPTLLSSVTFPVLSGLKGDGKKDQLYRIYKVNILVNVIFTVLVVLVVTFFSKFILGIYGEKYAGSQILLVILLFSLIPEALEMSLYQAIQAAGTMWSSLLLIVIPRDLSYLVICSIFIGKFGLMAVVIGYFISRLIGLFSTALIAKKSFL